MNSMLMLLTTTGVALLFAASSLFLWLRVRALEKEFNRAQLNQQQLAETVLGVGKKLISLQKELHALASKLQNDMGDSNEYKAYSQAARLLQQGESLDMVVKRCHLTRSEAELLSSMHRAAQGERPH